MTRYKTTPTELSADLTYCEADFGEFESWIVGWDIQDKGYYYAIQLWLEGNENVITGRIEAEQVYEAYRELTGRSEEELDLIPYHYTEDYIHHVFKCKYYSVIKSRIEILENE